MTSSQIPSALPKLRVVAPDPPILQPSEKPTAVAPSPTRSIFRQGAIVSLGLAGLTGLVMLPVSHTVSGDAVVESTPGHRAAISLPEAARIDYLLVRQGDSVRHGQSLLALSSVDLDRQLDELERQITIIKSEQVTAQQQAIAAQSLHQQQQLKYTNSLARSARLQQDTHSNVPRLQQLEALKAEKQSRVDGLTAQQQLLQSQIDRYQPLVAAGGLPRDRLTELEMKRQDISSQIEQATHQQSQTDAQIADVQKQQADELLNLRQPEVDNAATEVQTATAQIQKAEAEIQKFTQQLPQLESSRQKLLTRRQNLTVRSPLNGVVIDPNLDLLVGQTLPPGKPVLTVADPTQLSPIVEIKPEDHHLIRVGMPVVFRPHDAQMSGLSAKVVEISPIASVDEPQQKRSIKVRLTFDHPPTVPLLLATKGTAHIQVEQLPIYEKVRREFLKLVPLDKLL